METKESKQEIKTENQKPQKKKRKKTMPIKDKMKLLLNNWDEKTQKKMNNRKITSVDISTVDSDNDL